jgi:hypothetical protein
MVVVERVPTAAVSKKEEKHCFFVENSFQAYPMLNSALLS